MSESNKVLYVTICVTFPILSLPTADALQRASHISISACWSYKRLTAHIYSFPSPRSSDLINIHAMATTEPTEKTEVKTIEDFGAIENEHERKQEQGSVEELVDFEGPEDKSNPINWLCLGI